MKHTMPLASTTAIVKICPLSVAVSRKSLRFKALSHIASPAQVARACPRRVRARPIDSPVTERHHAIGRGRDGRVVRDDGGRRAELAIDAIEHFEDQNTRAKVQRAR